jgi:diguanylate cyclase (GGDEF)-like protein
MVSGRNHLVPVGPEHDLGGLNRRGLRRRATPFVALILAGFLVLPLPPVDHPAPLLAAGTLFLALLVSAALLPWQRLPGWVQVLPLLACLAVVALLRDAEGGAVSPEAALALVPVIWCALYGTRRQLGALIAGMALMFIVPRVFVGGPEYPVTEWERAFIWPLTGLLMGLTVQGLVARIKRQADQLKELAGTDALTGLANRRTWDEALAREIGRVKRGIAPLVLVLLDLNGFKTYNDVHGHPAADRFLKEMASAWAGALRPTDTLARLGGDEFGLILPSLSTTEAQAVVERLKELVPGGQTFASGLVETDGAESIEDVLVRADAVLYASKTHRARAGNPGQSPDAQRL